MKKHLSLLIALTFVLPQTLWAQAQVRRGSVPSVPYAVPSSQQRLQEIARLDTEISGDIVQLDLLKHQLRNARLRTWSTIGLSALSIAALMRGLKMSKAGSASKFYNWLAKRPVQMVGWGGALTAGGLAIGVGLKDAAELSSYVEEASADLKAKQARFNQLYQANTVR